MYIALYGTIFKILEDKKKMHLPAAGNKRLPRKRSCDGSSPSDEESQKKKKTNKSLTDDRLETEIWKAYAQVQDSSQEGKLHYNNCNN